MSEIVGATPEGVAQNGALMDGAEAGMYCTRCGTRNTIDANYCKQCGRKMEKPSPPPLSDDEYALPGKPDEKVSELLVLAFHRSEAHDLEGAIKFCSEALEILPDSTSAHSLMGVLYEKKGERSKAIVEFEKVLELNPGSIADREKLEQLRDATTQITPRKIITSRKLPRPVLFDGQSKAAVAALAVFFLVVMIGAWAVWMRGQKPTTAAPLADNRLPANGPVPTTMGAQQQVTSLNSSPPVGQQQVASNALNQGMSQESQNANRTGTSSRLDMTNPRRSRQPDEDGSEVNPVQVDLPSQDRLERFSRSNGGAARDTASTIHLPDNNQAAPESGAPAATGNPAPAPTNPAPPPNRGKIEIVVSPAGSSAPGTVRAGNSEPASSMDSRAQRAMALQKQLNNNYRGAVRDYLKSLDGAGDDSAMIHQQVAVCYQRLEEKESAIAHYNDAISEYKKQITAGKNVDSAKSGIRFCEAGIRNCQ